MDMASLKRNSSTVMLEHRIMVQEIESLAAKYRMMSSNEKCWQWRVGENFSSLAQAMREQKKPFEAIA